MLLPDHTPRVMIVDPDTDLANTMAEQLRIQGYSVRTVHVPDAALMLVERFRPHFVIAEVSMTGMNGIDLANRIVEQDPDCAILLTSSVESVIHTMEAIPAQVLPFRRKPLELAEILQFLTDSLQDGNRAAVLN